MNDAVDRVILERQALDRGFPGSVALSALAHGTLAGSLVLVTLLVPPEPPLQTSIGFVVELPRGGGGAPEPPAPAPEANVPPATLAPEPPQEAPPTVLKPPKEEPPRHTLPNPDRKHAKKPTPAPPAPGGHKAGAHGTPHAGQPAGVGTASDPFGIEFGPAGPGIPNGTSTGGDWYIATVQQKIWMIWTQQLKDGFTRPIRVSFTILADGSLDPDVRVTEPSGSALLDFAAKRAVYSAAPFGPLPKDYGTNRYTIEAVFRPTS